MALSSRFKQIWEINLCKGSTGEVAERESPSPLVRQQLEQGTVVATFLE